MLRYSPASAGLGARSGIQEHCAGGTQSDVEPAELPVGANPPRARASLHAFVLLIEVHWLTQDNGTATPSIALNMLGSTEYDEETRKAIPVAMYATGADSVRLFDHVCSAA